MLLLGYCNTLFALQESKVETVLPEYTAEHYGYQSEKYLGMDSCGSERFQYQTMHGSDQRALANGLILTTPHSDCIWDILPTEITLGMPADFPGNSDDLYAVRAKGFPGTALWVKECKNMDGYHIDTAGVILSAKYVCPMDSTAYSWGDCRGGCPGISRCKKNIVCHADTVARSLDSVLLPSAGHTGIAIGETRTSNESVLEVLNKPTVIQVNTIDKFRSETRYWGARFQPIPKPADAFLSYDEGLAVLESGYSQSAFNPKYVFFPYYVEGKANNLTLFNAKNHVWQTFNSITPGMFRCDTFVIYSYLKGANISLPYNRSEIDPLAFTPKQLFSNDFTRERIKSPSLINEDDGASARIDAEYRVLKNPAVSRAEKIRHFKERLQKVAANNSYDRKEDTFESAGYVLNPHELTRDLISTYEHTQNIDLKISIIHVLGSTSAYISELASQQPTPILAEESIAIQTFIDQIALRESDPKIIREIVFALAQTVLPEDALRIMQELSSQNQKMNALSPFERVNAQFILAKALAPSDSTYLENLLASSDHDDANLLENIVITHLKDMTPTQIDALGTHAIVILEHYLSKYDLKTHMLEDTLFKPSPAKWLGAYAAVSVPGKTLTTREAFMAHYIATQKNRAEQLALMASQEPSVIKQLPKTVLDYWRGRIALSKKQTSNPQQGSNTETLLGQQIELLAFSSIIHATGPIAVKN